jgi:hypothetical protein
MVNQLWFHEVQKTEYGHHMIQGEGSCSGSTMQEESVSTVFKEGYTNVALWSSFECNK